MISYWIFDDFHQDLARSLRFNFVSLQQLRKKTRETFVSTGHTRFRVDFDQNVISRVDINTQSASLVERRIEKTEKALVK